MKQFIDREKHSNLHDGVEYFAVGLVDKEYPDTPSGKELAVTFIDPWGEVNHEWRSRSEVILSDISEYDAMLLQMGYDRLSKQGEMR
jgi:hypothetical protein